MKAMSNEIHVVTVQRNGYIAYLIKRGDELITELASKPSDDDVRNALRLYAEKSTTQDSTRVRQLSEKNFRHGQFPRDDDDPRAA